MQTAPLITDTYPLTGWADAFARFEQKDGIKFERALDLAATLPVAAEIAGWYWQSRKCNVHADRDELESVTRAINGGANGLPQRANWLKQFKKELGL